MLIDPPPSLIRMTIPVAEARGLKKAQSIADRKRLILHSGLQEVDVPDWHSPDYVYTQRRVQPEDRQVADLSISHEADYAMAVVQTLNEPFSVEKLDGFPVFVDDGSGEPRHFQGEPVLEVSSLTKETDGLSTS